MTVSYQYEVASSTSGGFTRLLFMWRGSLYKLIYRELLLFLVAFALLSALYRNAFTLEQKRLFEKVVIYCDTFINLIPLSFVLGFYVAYVANRWWQQFMAIPWPDKTMHSLALYVSGNDEQARILRRTLMRYLNLSLILVLRSISSAVKRRFPTMDHLVEAGFMTRIELEMFNAVPNLEFNTYWIPCSWFITHLKEARRQNKITDPQGLKLLMEEFNEFRSKCGLLWSYDWISIPLVYTQVVTLATYSFFLAALVGRQYVEEAKKQLQMEIDIYLPVFTILQFFFFMGLLKVAEQLINPFGDDDEDFELNWLIDRHTKVSYLGVDTLMEKAPPLVKDKYFNDVDLTLPYTGAAVAYKKKTYRGSVHNMTVPEDQQSMFLPDITEEDETESNPPQKNTPKNSFSNLFSGGSMGGGGAVSGDSGSAGIWRQSGDSFDIERMAAPEEIPVSTQTTFTSASAVQMKKFTKKGPRLPTPIARDRVFLPDFQGQCTWSSNSTIDSFCSTTNVADAAANSSLENPQPPHDEVIEEKETKTKKKVKRKRTESENSTGCLAGLNVRRLSSVSGQWKGVRWKPFLDHSVGDVWSDNRSLRPVTRRASDFVSSTATAVAILDYKMSVEPSSSVQARQNTDPILRRVEQQRQQQEQRLKCEAFRRGCSAFEIIGKTHKSNSLPNLKQQLSVSSTSSSEDYVEGEE